MNGRVRKEQVVVSVVGLLDAVSAPRLRAALDTVLRRPGARPVVLDLLGVSSLLPAGVAALAEAARQAHHHRRPLRVVLDPHRQLSGLELVAELEQTLTLCGSLTDALRISAPPSGELGTATG